MVSRRISDSRYGISTVCAEHSLRRNCVRTVFATEDAITIEQVRVLAEARSFYGDDTLVALRSEAVGFKEEYAP